MIYDYSVYYRQNCLVPLFLLLFCVPALVYSVISLVSSIKSSHACGANKIIGTIFMVCMCLYLIIAFAIPLLRGGIYLLTEKENDAVQIFGTVEEKIELGFYGGGRYDAENNHGYGEAIIVGGVKYYLTTYHDIKIGDYVMLEVLPRSKFVLSMVPGNGH